MVHSSFFSIVTSLFALAAVLGLIVLAARLLRMSGFVPKSGGRLQLKASLALDPRRRLCLVRADGREFLLLTGGGADLLVAEIIGHAP